MVKLLAASDGRVGVRSLRLCGQFMGCTRGGVYADDTCLLKPGPGYCSCTTLTNHVVDLRNIRIDLHPGDGKPT